MPARCLSCAVAASAFLVLAAPANGSETEAAPRATPAAAGQDTSTPVAKARALMTERRYGEALAILRPLTGGRTIDADTVFLRGVAALEGSQEPGLSVEERNAFLDEAVASFRVLLDARPDLVRVRLELARAFFFQRKDSLAREHFERVLAGDLPPPVVANVRVFLAKIRARRRWRLYFGAALAPDSNIGAASDQETITFIGLPFQRSPEDLPTSGVGLSVWGGGEYVRPLGARTALRMGGDLSRREHKGRRFDDTNLAVHVGPRWLVGPRADVSVLASARRRLVERSDDYDEYGIRVETARRLTPRMSATARASWHDRRHRKSRILDGPVLNLSLGANRVITPTLRLNASVGYSKERPEWVRNRYTGRQFRIGARWALPRGFSVGGSVQVRWTDYEAGFLTPGGEPREDRTRALSASILHRRFTLYGFSPRLVLTNEARSSNAETADYRRTHAEIRLVRQF